MPKIDVTVEVCGMAGDGTIAAGGLINEALSHGGFSVLGFDYYPAEIRGFGRCVTRSRIGSEDILTLADKTHALISLDDEQSLSRAPFLSENASVLFDNKPPSYVDESKSLPAHLEPGMKLFGMPFSDLATTAAGTARGRNLTALGGFAAIFGVKPELFIEVISKKFGPKGEKILRGNIRSFQAGYDFALEEFRPRLSRVFSGFRAPPAGSERVMLSGNTAIGKAALDADLKLYFGYPITPATPIMEYLAKHLPSRGGRVVQMEDEISSIGAVLGSFYAGRRAMTATSGPGFALMTELITHGVMAEIPAVILNAQRGGPSTGLPTKTEQSDLHAAVFGGPGDSARIVVAPTNVEECYTITLKSFQWAEKYQTPVIVLTDFFLDNRVENLAMPEAKPEDIKDANIYPEVGDGQYKRYAITDSGISPRAIPGMEGFNFVATGLEHTEANVPDYSSEVHMAMTQKRYRKLAGALADLPEPIEFSPDGELDVGVIGWGSTFGSLLEAVNTARDEGFRTGALKVVSLYPIHEGAIRAFINKSRHILVPELNFSGQFADLIEKFSAQPIIRLNRVTGTPMSPTLILDSIKEITRRGAL
jgi:2-oxoglutarate/2-oxoacid ferredoxin oxidoreductase subunit alpha